MGTKIRVLHDSSRTILANKRFTLMDWVGKGTVHQISFLANTATKISLVLQVDYGEKKYLPTTDFLYNNVGITRDILYVHQYSTTDSKYGYTLKFPIKFDKHILVELSNENDTNVTIHGYFIILEEE